MTVIPVASGRTHPTTANRVSFTGINEDGTGGTGKAVASAFVPGLGQLFDGRFISGAAFLGGSIGLWAMKHKLEKPLNDIANKKIAEALAKGEISGVKSMFRKSFEMANTPEAKNFIKSPQYKKARLAWYGILALYVLSIIDAYRGRKSNNKD